MIVYALKFYQFDHFSKYCIEVCLYEKIETGDELIEFKIWEMHAKLWWNKTRNSCFFFCLICQAFLIVYALESYKFIICDVIKQNESELDNIDF